MATETVEPETIEGDRFDPVFIALVELEEARGNSKLNERVKPGQVYPIPIDDTWRAWVNPHRVEAQVPEPEEPFSYMAGTVPPYHAYITYNGWAWGIVSPFGGVTGTHEDPDGATRERFLRDCRAVIQSATPDAESEHGE